MRAPHSANPEAEVDVLVVGAGPAGAVAARRLAATGAEVLLVDRAQFPRWKICGCCLNGAALRTLEALGMPHLVTRLGAVRLQGVRLACRGHVARLALPDGVALSRFCFDQALIAEAMASGVAFRSRTTATWIGESADAIHVSLKADESATPIRARVVIAADGLAAGFTRRIPGVRAVPARAARIGAGTIVDDPSRAYGPHQIHMLVGSGGYVGLVRLEDGALNVAAAFDTRFVHTHGGLAAAARCIIEESGLPAVPALDQARWQGTPPLTRSYAPPPSGRLFLVGDAAEYVEPFTGEGMAWALASGAAVGRHAEAALQGAGPSAQSDWLRQRCALLSRQTRRCRWIARTLRYPRVASLAVRLLHAYPRLAERYLGALNRASVTPG